MSDIRKAQIWEDGLRTDPAKKSFEWWYLDSNFSDGTTIVITFYTKSPSKPAGPLTPQVEITVNKKNGEKLYYNKYYDKSEFSASKDKCNVKIGPNTLVGDLKKYKVHIEMPEITCDLEFDALAPSYSTSVARHPKNPEYFGWFCAIPYGSAKGNALYENDDHKLTGFGYHDHNWGILNIKDICDYWYWGRGNAGDYSMIFSVMYLPKIFGGHQASVFYLAKGDKTLIEDSNHLKVTKIDIDPPTPKVGHLPKSLTFSFENEEFKAELALSDPALIETKNPLQDETGLKKIITNIFSKPLYVRYNANLDFSLSEKGKTDTKIGKGLYEIMILR